MSADTIRQGGSKGTLEKNGRPAPRNAAAVSSRPSEMIVGLLSRRLS